MERPSDTVQGRHDLVVIGASAGGVETLRRVVADLPADLAAAVCVVLHVAPTSPSALPQILARAGPLHCRAARDGDVLQLSEILVAPPDRHLVVEDGGVRLNLGPREHGHRPAVDVLFRSAASAQAKRVVGVILSGTRDDGAAGLAVIKARGGATVVQDPAEAMYGGMPSSALAQVTVDAVAPSSLVASTLVAIVNGAALPPGVDPGPDVGEREARAALLTTICPECGGVLSERTESGVTQWRCRVGHRYTAQSLIDAQAGDVEAALWAAVRALEDRRILLERMARQLEAVGQSRSARSFRRRASDAHAHAGSVRAALAQAAATSLRTLDDAEAAGIAASGGDIS